MKILFFHSFLCPRCLLAARTLKKETAGRDDLELVGVEVTADPKMAWQEGIRMIPALKIGNDILSGLWLTPQKIREFINRHAR